ncbi:unnamed protein product [Caenorhabditis brenneri]
MYVTKKATHCEYEYEPEVRRSHGLSLRVFFYLNLLVTVCLMSYFLHFAHVEIAESRSWSLKNEPDSVLIFTFQVMCILLSIYTVFVFLLFFVPVRLYPACGVVNTIWFIITICCLFKSDISETLKTATVVTEKMTVNMMFLSFGTPLTLLHSVIMTVVLIRIKRFMQREECEYQVMHGEKESDTKKLIP